MRTARLIAVVLPLAAAACDRPAPPPPPTTRAATAPATSRAATAPTTGPVATWMDAILRDDPKFPTTKPLDAPLELTAAARLTRDEPVFLCSRGDLWITRDDAPPTAEVLAAANRNTTHATREKVKFVNWRPASPWAAELIVADDAGGETWVTAAQRLPLAPNIKRDWTRAFAWNTDKIQAIAVPTDDGFSILRLRGGGVDEDHVTLATPADGVACFAAYDPRGLLAWSNGGEAASKVARFADGRWQLLDQKQRWPEQIVSLLPLLDGTVLAIARDGDRLALSSVPMETLAIDEQRVRDLVARLGDRLPENREAAQNDLAAIGPAAWPLLEQLAPAQRPEARIRIRAILGSQNAPTLFGITPLPGPSRLLARLRDGGVVLQFDGGAKSVDASGNEVQTAPSWLAVRPGRGVAAVPAGLARALLDPHVSLKSWGDEWVVEGDTDGPRRWVGNHFEPLTLASERDFRIFVGIDGAGRWIFSTTRAPERTLVVDPTLPDPTPRLPVWAFEPGQRAGWTKDDWPAVTRGGAWTLKQGNWAALRGNVDELILTKVDPAATKPASLLTDSSKATYDDGVAAITVRHDGKTQTWPLPPEATGDGSPVTLIEADDRLFLFNAPGRVVRLKRQFDEAAPLALDGLFTRSIPASDVRRIWKDPAGRICIASGGDRVAICFPSGRIPQETANLMSASALREALQREGEKDAK